MWGVCLGCVLKQRMTHSSNEKKKKDKKKGAIDGEGER